MSRTLHQERHPAPPRPAPAPAKPPIDVPAPAHTGAGHSLSQIAISAPGDAAEQQADAVAAEVLRRDGHGRGLTMLDGAGADGGPPPDGPPSDVLSGLLSVSSDSPTLQRKETGTAPTPPSARADVGLSGGGTPLDPATRAFMEPRFNHDFSHVRVHTGPDAAQSADSLAARAFTVGSDIAFRLGEYSPGTSSGKELLAHELTHVVQQRGGRRGVQRKPVPGGQPAWQGPVKPGARAGGADTGSGDVRTFEAAAARWLSDALDKSAQITQEQRKSLGLSPRGGLTDGGAGMKKLQTQARILALMQDHEREAEWEAADRLSPVRTSSFDGGDATDWGARNRAANSDPTVQGLRKRTLDKQKQLGKTNPILLSSEVNFGELGEATPEHGAEMAAGRLAQIEKAIGECRAALGSGSLTIWHLPELIPTAMQQLGIAHRTPLGMAIEARQLENEKKKTDHEWWVAAFQLGLGVASLLTAGAGMVFAGGLGEGTTLAMGAATTVPSLINDAYTDVKDLGQYNQDKMLANTHLDQHKALKQQQPSVAGLVGDAFSTVVDVFGAGMLIRDASQLKVMRGLATDVEEVVDRAAPVLSEHAPQKADAEIKRMAAQRADELIGEGRLKPGMKGKFVQATEKVWTRRFGKAMHVPAEGTGPHPAGGVHPEGVSSSGMGHPPATAHPTAGHPAAPHPAPEPFVPPTIESPKAQVLDTGRRNAAGQLEVGGHGEYIPTKTPEQLRAIHEQAVAHHKAPTPEPAAAPAESAPAHGETGPIEAPAAETPLAPAEAAPPKTVVTKNGATVTEGGGRPKTIEYEGGARFQEGDGWRDADGKRVYPKTVHHEPAGGPVETAPARPAAAETRPVPTADGPGVSTTMRDAFERSPRKSKAVRDALAEPTTEAIPVSAEDTLLAPREGKIVHDTEQGAVTQEAATKAKAPLHQDPFAEFPVGKDAHAPAEPVALSDLSAVDKARAELNALREQRDYHLNYEDNAWTGAQPQIDRSTGNVSTLGRRIGDAEKRLQDLEAKARLPKASDMKARVSDPVADPIALINQNQSWGRLGELNLGESANRRLLAARDALVMRIKTEIEEAYHVFIHAGNGERVIDKVTAGKVTTDIDLVVASRAEGEDIAQAALGEGSQLSRPAEARAELQRRLNDAFSGDSNAVAMVNVFMGDKRIPFRSAQAGALKAAQDSEGMVEGLRGLHEVDPAAYKAQRDALLSGAGKDDPRIGKLIEDAEAADKMRVDEINAQLKQKGIENPDAATPKERAAAQERVRQDKEIAAQDALHEYEAARATATPEELDVLAQKYNRAIQQSAIHTPEAYTPHGALELPLSKREIALGTIDGKDLTAPVAAQAALGETRMFLDVLHHTATPVNRAAHCAKYVGRFLNQFLQVIDLDRYPLIARLRSNPEAFQMEMVAVKDVGDENAKIRRLLDVLGDDGRNPTAVVQEFISQSEQMMADLNSRLVKKSLGVGEAGEKGASAAATAPVAPAPERPPVPGE